MLKKRIIFSLLYKDQKFCLSRNFRLQEIGDINWLLKSYNFEEIAESIDELMILNLSTSNTYNNSFLTDIAKLTKNFFVPITIGGKIRNLIDANEYFSAGADKISLNTIYLENHGVAAEIAEKYGSQAVVASIDYKAFFQEKIPKYKTYNSGSNVNGEELFDRISMVQNLGCGEILIRSVDNDGTGNGLDLKLLEFIPNGLLTVPLIFAGGIGKSEHMHAGLSHPGINAVCTANLLNFVNHGLINARKRLELSNLPISKISQQ
jgi:cyclase